MRSLGDHFVMEIRVVCQLGGELAERDVQGVVAYYLQVSVQLE